MGFWSIFKRSEPAHEAEAAPAVAAGTKESRASLTIKGDEAMLSEIRAGLALVKQRRNLRSQADAAAFLIRSFRAHEERRLTEQGIVTIKTPKQAASVIASAASALPDLPKVTLAQRKDVEDRIALCNDVLAAIRAGRIPSALRKDWEYRLHANDRLLTLISSGHQLECRRSAGVLVDQRHYYRPGPGKAKIQGGPGLVSMEVNTFIAEIGARRHG